MRYLIAGISSYILFSERDLKKPSLGGVGTI